MRVFIESYGFAFFDVGGSCPPHILFVRIQAGRHAGDQRAAGNSRISALHRYIIRSKDVRLDLIKHRAFGTAADAVDHRSVLSGFI